jgi:hypothetical protein
MWHALDDPEYRTGNKLITLNTSSNLAGVLVSHRIARHIAPD